MRVALLIAYFWLASLPFHADGYAGRSVTVPVLGTWQIIGTAPPGFVRYGAEVARLTLSLQRGHLHALVLTGPHRYATTAQYSATRHELLLSVRTVKGRVRLQATLGPGSGRMIGTWNDTRGDDGGFVLVRIAVHSVMHH